ncbi:MAG TPA: hypothetical protein EYH40_04925 [Desulfurococcales archaeon]|nr:hypothetical protein [Desulfurococcales archaeon]
MIVLVTPLLILLSILLYTSTLTSRNSRVKSLLYIAPLVTTILLIYPYKPLLIPVVIAGFILFILELYINSKYLALIPVTTGMSLILILTYELGRIYLTNTTLLNYILFTTITYMILIPYSYRRLKRTPNGG